MLDGCRRRCCCRCVDFHDGITQTLWAIKLIFLHGDLSWLFALNPNLGAILTHADRPNQPNLYFWEEVSQWANLIHFHPILFKSCTEVICKPINGFRIFEVAATIFRPTSPTNPNRPKAKIFNFVFFVRFGWNLVWGLILTKKQHRMSLKFLRLFFDQPARPTKTDQ